MSQNPYSKDKYIQDRGRKDSVTAKRDKGELKTPTRTARAIISKFEASDTNRKNVGLGGYISSNVARSRNSMDLSTSQVEDIKNSLKDSAKKLNKKVNTNVRQTQESALSKNKEEKQQKHSLDKTKQNQGKPVSTHIIKVNTTEI